MFVDHIKIHAKSGDGGHGCVSFRREKYVPKGGPDGGDGGKGANVILEVSPHVDNLRDFFYRPRHKAPRGMPGQGKRRTGRSGKDLVLPVPPGTLVYRVEDEAARFPGDDEEWEGEIIEDEGTLVEMDRDEGLEDESFEDDEETSEAGSAAGEVDPDLFEGTREGPPGELIADLLEVGERFTLCEGGIGGKGNWHFRSDTNQAPVEFTPGEPGEEGWFYLELRKIADAGLVGFPNAGKSTLLRTLSNAEPKVAAYPFTTLKPMVGVVDFPGFLRATVADIPGLIEGAHRNVGLGHDFLRHISRCSVFLFVVDAAAVDQRDPISDLETLRTELRLYDEELGRRDWLIVANKIDLEESELFLPALQQRFPGKEIFPISAEHGDGLDALKARLAELVGKRPE